MRDPLIVLNFIKNYREAARVVTEFDITSRHKFVNCRIEIEHTWPPLDLLYHM